MKTYTQFLNIILLCFPFCCMAKAPKVWNIDTNTTIVTGRETEIKDIYNALNKQNKDTEILAITGLPGYGKTEISKAYAKTYRDEYDVCWIFDSKRDLLPQIIDFSYQWNKSFPDNQISITENKRALLQEIRHVLKKSNADLLFILDNINPDKESISNFKKALRTSESNWLLIFDNTSDFDCIRELIPAHHTDSKGHVLITSQNTETWPNVYKLNVLNRENVIKLFNVNEEDKADLENIAQALKYHPFAIYKAYKEIQSQQYSLKDYSNMIQGFKSQTTLDPAIKMTQMHIAKFTSENKLGNNFIELLYLMDNNFVPEYLLKSIWLKMGHSETELNILITEASRYLILETPHQQNISDVKFYKYHDIVKSSFEKSISKEKQLQISKSLAKILFSHSEIDEAPYLTENFSHKIPVIENLASISNKFNDINIEISDLYLNNVEYLALVKRDFHRCVKFISANENVNKFISQSAPKEQAVRFHTTLSGIYWWLGDHKLGLFHQKNAEKISKDINVTKSVQFERILNYAASHYLFLGESEKALEYIKRLQTINDGKVDDAKFDSSNLVDLNRANYFNLVGDYQKSIALVDKIYSNIKDKAEQRFLYHIPVYMIRYETYMYINAPTISLSEISNTVNKLSEALGDQHRLTARAKILLAGHMVHHDKIQEAKDILLKQITILDAWFGDKIQHKEKALAFQILGDCYYKEENYHVAKAYYEKSYEQYHNGFANIKNHEVRKILSRLIAVNAAESESAIVYKLLADYKSLFGKDKQYDQVTLNLATKKHLELSEL